MTPREFCYWLQGFFELADPKELTTAQLRLIEKHLELVKTYEDMQLEKQTPIGKLNHMLNAGKVTLTTDDLPPGVNARC